MKLGIIVLLTFVITLFLLAPLNAQQKYYSTIVIDTLHVNFENSYHLSNPAVIPFTETIRLNRKLLNNNDYKMNYESAAFKLSDSLQYSVFDTLIVAYQAINLNLQSEYKKRSLVYKFDEKSGDTLKIAKQGNDMFSSESIFGKGIEKSGTLVRGFTVGTTTDFTLKSGLRLQLSGKLSNDIEVVAALTDENSPIQPEGNTANLEELDKVFIQVKHPNVTGTFGDYELQEKTGEFGVVDRKLQGLLGEFNYDGQKGFISVASSKGKFTTNQFNGSDGVQGPYQLSGANGEIAIIIIAGTEKVYIDGVEVKRGERNDYIIDYANAQITFTPNKLITSASRISIDFEYTDRQYERTFFGAGVKAQLFEKKLSVQFQYSREGDNQDAPVDISLSDSDKQILAAAGNDRFKATKSGIAVAPPDSQGVIRGVYQKIDTVINSQPYSYYLYNPGAEGAVYNLTFSYVGEMQGDYIRQSIGNFKFVGTKQGNYLPLIFLPLPELKQLGNLVLNYKYDKGIEFGLELAGSLWDRNRFSSIDDSKDGGYARNAFINFDPREIKIGNTDLGKIGFSYKDRYIEDRFTTLDRINPVEFNRYFNVSDSTSGQSEQLREFNLSLIPVKELNITSSYGYLKRGNDFISNRFNNTLVFSDNNLYRLEYNLDYVQSENLYSKSNWLRQRGSAYYLFGKLKPGIDFLAEDKKDYITGVDSVLSSSLKYYELDPFLELVDFSGFKLSAKYSLRQDYAPLNGELLKQATSSAEYFEINYSGMREFNSTLNLTVNNKYYSDAFKKNGSLNSQTILVRSQSRFNFAKPVTGDLYYEVSTQKSAKLQKVFIKVAQGAGNYIYLGDLNHNGIQDENEFQPTLYDGNYALVTVPTDQLYPVIDLKVNTRWKIRYGEIFKDGSLAQKIMQPLSSETYWRIEENTQEQDYKKIYLLQLSDFQNPDKTIYGTNLLQQDIFLFENDPDFSMRLRFSQTKSMNQYNGGIEQTYNRERSIRINFKMIPEISNQTDLVNENDNARAPVTSTSRREITGNSVSSDFSYRPQNNIEVGFNLKVGRREDYFPAVPTLIDLNSQLLRFTFSFTGYGRLRIELERDELTSNSTDNYIPFELTEGNLIGKNYFWRLNFDYKIAANLQSTISYDGRLQGANKVIHTARAEVRAYF